MNIASTLDRLHSKATANSWLWLFSIFCRVALAAGFVPSGMVKILDERFAGGLSVNHPMGSYLEALHHTGFYYTFIGIVQIAAAIMLLIPRTVTLGAFLYFPVILNICILTYALRFDGSLFTAPLMVLANLFLLGWNYEKWKFILPFNQSPENQTQIADDDDRQSVFARDKISPLSNRFRRFLKQLFSDKFPTLFFASVFAAILICVIAIPSLYRIKPRNTMPQCLRQFQNTARTRAGEFFCQCVHQNGTPLDRCLAEYEIAANDTP